MLASVYRCDGSYSVGGVMDVTEKYLAILPEINAATGYGESSKIIRKHVDKHFGKGEHEKPVKYHVQIQMMNTRTITVEAYSQDIAEEMATDELKEEGVYNDYDEVEVVNIWEASTKD